MAPWRHIFLVTDIEGVAGVDSWDQTQSGAPHDAAKALATAEVNSVLDVLLAPTKMPNLDAPRVSIWDGHGYGGLLHDRINPRATVYRHDDARGFPGLLRLGLGEDIAVDAIGFIGQHAMEGSGGTLAHTYSSKRIRSYTLNGRPVGEFDLRALYAWALARVPAVIFSGDDIACREARSLVPGIVTVQVKESLGVTSARHLDPIEACALLAAGARKIRYADTADTSLQPCFYPLPPYDFRKHYKLKFGFIPRPPRSYRGDNLVEILGHE
jgi:D-amino peptidase